MIINIYNKKLFYKNVSPKRLIKLIINIYDEKYFFIKLLHQNI